MEQQINPQVEVRQSNIFTRVTPLSKILAMALFIALPFIGGFVGYKLAPEKIVEVEKIIVMDDSETVDDSDQFTTYTLAHELAPELRKNDDGPFGVIDPERLYLYVGENKILLTTVSGRCDIRQEIDARHLIGEGFVSNPEQIVSQISCWWGGGGSDTHLVVSDGKYKVLHYETGECGNSVDCSPNGPIEMLYEGS